MIRSLELCCLIVVCFQINLSVAPPGVRSIITSETCTVCGITFSSSNLERNEHMKSQHPDDYARKLTEFRENLRKRREKKNKRSEDLIEYVEYCSQACQICNRTFNSSQLKTAHMTSEHSENNTRLEKCDVCDKSCGPFFAKINHLKTRHPKHLANKVAQSLPRARKCEICGDTFPSFHIKMEHLRDKHADELNAERQN